MFIYIFIFLFLFIGSILGFAKIDLSYKRMMFYLAALLIFCFVAFRGNGYDYDNYRIVFDLIKDGNKSSEDIEYIYYLINLYFPNYELVQIFIALLNCFLLTFFIKRYSPYPIFSLLVLLCTFLLPTYMGQHRQGLAIAISLWAFVYKDNLKIFFSLLVLAIMFHTSAVFVLVSLFLNDKFYSKWTYCCLFIGSILFRLLFLIFKNQITSFLPGGLIQDKFSFYEGTENYSIFFSAAIFIRLLVLYLVFTKKQSIYKRTYVSYFFNLYLFSVLIYWALGPVPQLGGRICQYYSILELLLIPVLFKLYRGNLRLLIIIGFYLINILRYVNFFASDFNYTSYVPYCK